MAPFRRESYHDLIDKLNELRLVAPRDPAARHDRHAPFENGSGFIPAAYCPQDVSPELARQMWELVRDVQRQRMPLSVIWGNGEDGILPTLIKNQRGFSTINRPCLRLEITWKARQDLGWGALSSPVSEGVVDPGHAAGLVDVPGPGNASNGASDANDNLAHENASSLNDVSANANVSSPSVAGEVGSLCQQSGQDLGAGPQYRYNKEGAVRLKDTTGNNQTDWTCARKAVAFWLISSVVFASLYWAMRQLRSR